MKHDFEELKNDIEIQNIGYKAAMNFKNQLNKEEIDSCFLIALWQACKYYNPDYDPQKIASFYTFLYKGVVFECMKMCKINSSYKKNINKIKNTIPEKIKSHYTEKFFRDLSARDFGLTPKETKILIQRFWENKTLREISEEDKVSPQAIKKRITKILKKMKEYSV